MTRTAWSFSTLPPEPEKRLVIIELAHAAFFMRA